MKKLLTLMGAVILSTSMAACGSDTADTTTEVTTEATADVTTEETDTEETTDDTVETMGNGSELRVNYTMGNNLRTITYNQSDPLTMPNGDVITAGDLKPVWQHLNETLNLNIVDVAVQDQPSPDMMQLEASTGFTGADIFGGEVIADELMSYGAQGYFVNLSEYMDQLPNFSAYLDENEAIKNAITAYDGSIYHIPYIAEINNYARVFTARQSIAELLLDGAENEPETATLDIAYEGYWKDDNARNATNVIVLQNEAAAANGGTLTHDMAKDILLQYINDNYDYENPSELYIGENAEYDIDEYIALLRLVKLSPNTFSKAVTGEVVEDALIQPIFTRSSINRDDILRLLTYFGGQRVYGSDSLGARFYTNEEGELEYSFAEEDFLDRVNYLHDMYAEGLISAEFSDLNNKTNFRTEYYGKDDVEDHQEFGFATIDWIASTTALGDDIVGILPPVTTTNSDEFVHFIENTRTIKSDGWAISSSIEESKLDDALLLVDYFFSEDGTILQNYGTPDMLTGGTFTGPDGVDYPELDDWIFDNADKFTSGDVSTFIKDFCGSLLAIGYQKQIGLEYQFTNDIGFDAWELYLGDDVEMLSYGADEPFYQLSPPTYSFNDQELAKLATTNIGDDQLNEIFKFILGSDGAKTTDEIRQMYLDSGYETFIGVYREAYERSAE